MSKAKPAAKTAKAVEQAAVAALVPVVPVQAAQEQPQIPAEAAAPAPVVVEQPATAPAVETTFVVTSPWGAASDAIPQEGAHMHGVSFGGVGVHTHSNAPQAAAQPAEPLDDFLRRIECAHIDRDAYAVAATHPDATARVWPGTYSGIRISQGDVSVTYSDGSKA